MDGSGSRWLAEVNEEGEQPTEQPSPRTTTDADGSQEQVDEDLDHADQQAATDS